MEHLQQDLQYALRTLHKRRGFSVVAILTLALGIGITTAIFSVVNGILLRPLPYRDSQEILTVWMSRHSRPTDRGAMSHLNFLDIRAQAPSIAAAVLVGEGTSTVTGDGPASIVGSAIVTPGLFDVFGVAPLLGRDFIEEEDRPNAPLAAIIGYGFWQERLGGARDVIGESVELSGRRYTIVGVAPQHFDFPSGAQLWTPMRNDDERCGRGCVYTNMYVRLAPGASVESANSDLETVMARIVEVDPESVDRTFRARTLQDSMVGDVRTALYVLLAAVAMVLLIACANVANLLVARGAGRRSEMAVRAALGAGRGRLVMQLMTENVVLALVAGVCGVLIAAWGVEALRGIAPAGIPRTEDLGLDATAVLFAFMLVIVTSLLFGLVPALQLARSSLGTAIREGGRGSDGSPRRLGRSAILVTEVALSIVLLLGAGLMMRSFLQLNAVDPGFDAQNVSTFTIGLPSIQYPTADEATQAFSEIRGRLAELPGVESAAIMVGVPFGDINFSTSFKRVELPPPDASQEPSAALRVIDEHVLGTLRIPLVRGRAFSAQDRHGSTPVALVSSAAAATYFPGEDPIGKQIEVAVGLGYPNEDPRTIVGVIGDIRGDNLQSEPRPVIYMPAAQAGAEFGSLLIRSALPAGQVLQAARTVLEQFNRDIPLESAVPLAGLVDRQLATPRFYLVLIGLFAALAVALAAVGIYGVVAYLVAYRTREIGIRMALGAHRSRVIELVVWQGLKPALAGVGVGIVVALAGVQVMSSMLYGVPPRDLPTYAAVTALLIIIVLLACALPAYRATRIPPAAALRSE